MGATNILSSLTPPSGKKKKLTETLESVEQKKESDRLLKDSNLLNDSELVAFQQMFDSK